MEKSTRQLDIQQVRYPFPATANLGLWIVALMMGLVGVVNLISAVTGFIKKALSSKL